MNEWMQERVLALLEPTDYIDLQTLVKLCVLDMEREYKTTIREMVLAGKINLNREWNLEPVKKELRHTS